MTEHMSSPAFQASSPCDLLLLGATLITMDPARPVIVRGAIGVTDNRLTLIGAESDVPASVRMQAGTVRRIDDHVVVPGFINVHTHAILSMVRGVAEDLGFAPAYTPGIPQGHDVRPDEAIALARLGALEAMLFGSTLINDTYVHASLTMEAMAELGLRVFSCNRLHDVDFASLADGHWEHHVSIGERALDEALTMVEKWHGKNGWRTGVQLAVHATDTCSDDFLRKIAEAAHGYGLRVTTHLAQSKVEVAQVKSRSGMSPAQLLEDVGLLNDQLLAAHCLYLDESDIRRVGQAGITVAHIPKGNATGGTLAPTPKLRASGARIALGTDNMHADMTEVMRWALAVARIQLGAVSPDWQPVDALAMASTNGAKAMGLGSQLGMLREGMLADLVAFDFKRPHLIPHNNPLGTLVHTGQGRDVDLVLVDGRIVVDKGMPTLCDMESVIEEGLKASGALWKRAASR